MLDVVAFQSSEIVLPCWENGWVIPLLCAWPFIRPWRPQDANRGPPKPCSIPPHAAAAVVNCHLSDKYTPISAASGLSWAVLPVDPKVQFSTSALSISSWGRDMALAARQGGQRELHISLPIRGGGAACRGRFDVSVNSICLLGEGELHTRC